MAKNEKFLPLSPMLVQYLVGLCALKWDLSAVDITLGHMVPDVGSGTERDVDVTVRVEAADGVHAFKGYEVKHWGTALDVSDVDGLVTKFNDMPTVTHRTIVSSAGYSQAAIAKAAKHSISLYTFKPWERPLAEQFPDLAPMTGPPSEHIHTLAMNLVWPAEHQGYWLLTAGSPQFTIAREGNLFDADGKVHSLHQTFGDFAEAMVRRSTGILIALPQIQDLTSPLVIAHRANAPMPPEPRWPYAHTLDVRAEAVYIRANDAELYRVESFTLSGQLKWEVLQTAYAVLEEASTGRAFAGAVVAPSDVPGGMWAILFPATGRDMSIRKIQLEDRHLNSIRDLKIALESKPPGSTEKP